MASIISSLKQSLVKALIAFSVLLGLFVSPLAVHALYPSDPSSVDGLKPDLHGKNLQNQEFVKYDLSGMDLSDADLRGSYFSVTNVRNANLKGANLKDVIAYATRFDNADLSGADLSNSILDKSVFDGTDIDGADFTGATLDLPQQKALCERASGKTFDSLDCNGLGASESYRAPVQALS